MWGRQAHGHVPLLKGTCRSRAKFRGFVPGSLLDVRRMQGAGAGPWGCSGSSAQYFGEPGSHLGWAVGPGGCLALREGERAEVKITPWAGSGPCGFLQFTALPGGRGGRNLPGSELVLTLSTPTEEALGPFLAAGTLGKGGSRGAPALELGSASPGQVERGKAGGVGELPPSCSSYKGCEGWTGWAPS